MVSACLSASVQELESSLRRAVEAHSKSLQATRQRAAQMLARKDAALDAARSRRGAEPAVACAHASGGGGTEAQGANAQGSCAASATAAGAAEGGANVLNLSAAPGTRSVGVGTEAALAAEMMGALLEADGVVASLVSSASLAPDSLASRFARRIAELEASLERMRESNSALEERRADDEKKRRVLRARVARQEKGGAADMEYLRNVLLRWFTMAPEERASLFPVICAACAFTPTELAAINRAREAAAPSSSWLPWRSASSSAVNSRRAFDDGA